MKKYFTLNLFMCCALSLFSQVDLLKEISKKTEDFIDQSMYDDITQSEVESALNQILEYAFDYAIKESSKDGGFSNNINIRIPFPEEAINVKRSLEKIGLQKEVTEFEHKINLTAEECSKQYSRSILIDIINNIKIDDAFSILRGPDNAATIYLKQSSYEYLYESFFPVVSYSMKNVNLARYWEVLIKKYNSIPFTKKININLDEYITNKTIDGIFILMSDYEQEIRSNVSLRTTDLLKKVFK